MVMPALFKTRCADSNHSIMGSYGLNSDETKNSNDNDNNNPNKLEFGACFLGSWNVTNPFTGGYLIRKFRWEGCARLTSRSRIPLFHRSLPDSLLQMNMPPTTAHENLLTLWKELYAVASFFGRVYAFAGLQVGISQ